MSKHSYPITHTADNAVNAKTLGHELRIGLDPDRISTLQILMDEADSSVPKSIVVSTINGSTYEQVGAIIAAHLGMAPRDTSKDCKIFRYLDGAHFHNVTDPPQGIDYVRQLTRRLHPARVKVQGEIVSVDYHSSAERDENGVLVPSGDIIVREELETIFHPVTSLHMYRDLEVKWALEDGTFHPTTKIRHKEYPEDEAIQASERRRKNIIQAISFDVIKYLIGTETTDPTDPVEVQGAIDLGRAFMAEHRDAVSDFVLLSRQQMHTDVSAATDLWLDNVVDAEGNTIRDKILAEINIWGL